MFSLRGLFGNGGSIYDLLNQSAEEGLHSIEALTGILANGATTPSIGELAVSHQKDKVIHQQIRETLATIRTGDFDRAETEALANALYKVPKTIEKFAERYILAAPRFRAVNFGSQIKMLDEAIRLVVAMLKDLRNKHFETVNEQNSRLQRIEGDADKLMLNRLGELYSGQFDAVTAVALRDLYDLLEKAIDHCRDAGNLVSQLVLKHS
jgi:uncharacterized protein Yka (UPF0111/DUF47 family)